MGAEWAAQTNAARQSRLRAQPHRERAAAPTHVALPLCAAQSAPAPRAAAHAPCGGPRPSSRSSARTSRARRASPPSCPRAPRARRARGRGSARGTRCATARRAAASARARGLAEVAWSGARGARVADALIVNGRLGEATPGQGRTDRRRDGRARRATAGLRAPTPRTGVDDGHLGDDVLDAARRQHERVPQRPPALVVLHARADVHAECRRARRHVRERRRNEVCAGRGARGRAGRRAARAPDREG